MTLQLAAVTASQSNTLNSVIPAAVDLGIILLLVVTRVHGRRLQPAAPLVSPLVLIAIGIGSSAAELHTTNLHGIDYLIGGIDLLDSLVVGTIRGFTVRLYQRDGAPWYRYGPATVALWLRSILIRVGLAILGSVHHASPSPRAATCCSCSASPSCARTSWSPGDTPGPRRGPRRGPRHGPAEPSRSAGR